MNRITDTIMPHKTIIRLSGVARNPANGFPARLLDIHLAIMDAIIGYHIPHWDFDTKIVKLVRKEQETRRRKVRKEQETIDNLPPDEQQMYIQDLVLQQEVISEMDNDLIQKEIDHIFGELAQLGCEYTGQSHEFMEEPSLPDLEYQPPSHISLFNATPESFKARIAARNNVMKVGCVFSLKTSIGEVSEIAWVRNIGNYSQSLVVSEKIAELMVYLKTLRLAKRLH